MSDSKSQNVVLIKFFFKGKKRKEKKRKEKKRNKRKEKK
jgi:hypothetical protein